MTQFERLVKKRIEISIQLKKYRKETMLFNNKVDYDKSIIRPVVKSDTKRLLINSPGRLGNFWSFIPKPQKPTSEYFERRIVKTRSSLQKVRLDSDGSFLSLKIEFTLLNKLNDLLLSRDQAIFSESVRLEKSMRALPSLLATA